MKYLVSLIMTGGVYRFYFTNPKKLFFFACDICLRPNARKTHHAFMTYPPATPTLLMHYSSSSTTYIPASIILATHQS